MISPLDCNILSMSNILVHSNGCACLAGFGLSAELFKEPEDDEEDEVVVSTIRGEIRWAAAALFKEPGDNEEHEAAVSLSTECDIYSFDSIFLQVLTCKVPYYNVEKHDVVLGLVIRGKKPEPPKDSVLAPVHWELVTPCNSSTGWRNRSVCST
ncbi:hypothetical protein M405DRAFT_514099 [Rhizopogon salebrosus TDB-379]|nr:hypothetical protein M405DRAFT_514099 [Rhizopogon salebrosus TDB-379]